MTDSQPAFDRDARELLKLLKRMRNDARSDGAGQDELLDFGESIQLATNTLWTLEGLRVPENREQVRLAVNHALISLDLHDLKRKTVMKRLEEDQTMRLISGTDKNTVQVCPGFDPFPESWWTIKFSPETHLVESAPDMFYVWFHDPASAPGLVPVRPDQDKHQDFKKADTNPIVASAPVSSNHSKTNSRADSK